MDFWPTFLRVLCVQLALLAGMCVLGANSLASGVPPPRYLALGDSLAAGDQPDPSGIDRPTNQGYVDSLGRRLGRVYPSLRIRDLGCGGATTRTVLHGGSGCDRPGGPSQLEVAERFLAAHRETALVTIDVGDNDIERCIHFDARGIDAACVARGNASLDNNLPQIARRLRAAAGRHTAVVGIVDYDQYLALWLEGAAGQIAARRSVPAIEALNERMAGIYRRAGVLVADAGARFATTDLRNTRVLPGFGLVPLAVYRICRWTWACSPPPIGHDDHANAAGYNQIAQSVLDALKTTG